jgi:hypothetical protein
VHMFENLIVLLSLLPRSLVKHWSWVSINFVMMVLIDYYYSATEINCTDPLFALLLLITSQLMSFYVT